MSENEQKTEVKEGRSKKDLSPGGRIAERFNAAIENDEFRNNMKMVQPLSVGALLRIPLTLGIAGGLAWVGAKFFRKKKAEEETQEEQPKTEKKGFWGKVVDAAAISFSIFISYPLAVFALAFVKADPDKEEKIRDKIAIMKEMIEPLLHYNYQEIEKKIELDTFFTKENIAETIGVIERDTSSTKEKDSLRALIYIYALLDYMEDKFEGASTSPQKKSTTGKDCLPETLKEKGDLIDRLEVLIISQLQCVTCGDDLKDVKLKDIAKKEKNRDQLTGLGTEQRYTLAQDLVSAVNEHISLRESDNRKRSVDCFDKSLTEIITRVMAQSNATVSTTPN